VATVQASILVATSRVSSGANSFQTDRPSGGGWKARARPSQTSILSLAARNTFRALGLSSGGAAPSPARAISEVLGSMTGNSGLQNFSKFIPLREVCANDDPCRAAEHFVAADVEPPARRR